MLEQFKAQHASTAGPWIQKSAVHMVQFEPTVSAIQIPQKLTAPALHSSGLVLDEAEGDLHDVKQMDHNHNHGFQSSFILHHLSTSPHVSAVDIMPLVLQNALDPLIANLPDDGPEVSFVSRVNRLDTVLAHVDTGATVMVTNIHGEIHGAVPTSAHCGTALTGSKTTIDALGTWMIDFVGSTDKQDLPMALCGTTQITDFQRRSISLHALKELGFDCSHVLTQKGNFLEIISAGNKFIFPLLTINGGDYIEIKIHRPPPETVAAYVVAHLDLAKNSCRWPLSSSTSTLWLPWQEANGNDS